MCFLPFRLPRLRSIVFDERRSGLSGGWFVKVLLLLSDVDRSAGPDEQDTLNQAEAVHQALVSLGHEVHELRYSLVEDQLTKAIQHFAPDVVFNLVEGINGSSELVHLAPAALESLKVKYTGACEESLHRTNHKLLAKQALRAVGLPTAQWVTGRTCEGVFEPGALYVIKPSFENGSLDILADAVVRYGALKDLQRELRIRELVLGRPLFAERYLSGKEYCVSMIERNGHLEVLPVCEIRTPRNASNPYGLLNYEMKWRPPFPGFHDSIRSFHCDYGHQPLIHELAMMARKVWELFRLRGVARIDLRLGDEGRPYILEVNANPSLSPSAGLAASCNALGISFRELIRLILKAALGEHDPRVSHPSQAVCWHAGAEK